MFGEHPGIAFFIETDDVVRLFGVALLHTRGADRHAWNRDSGNLRSEQQQALDVAVGNMALDDIAIDDSSMAGSQFLGYAEALFHFENVSRVLDGNLVILFLEIANPLGAAAAFGIFVDHDFFRQAVIGLACIQSQNAYRCRE